jgi:hypothetical protein
MPTQVSFSAKENDIILGIDLMFAPSNNKGERLLHGSDSKKDMLPFTAIHEDSGMSVPYGGEESADSDDSDDESFSVAELTVMDSFKRADSKRHTRGLGLLLRSDSIKDMLPFTAIYEDSAGISISYAEEESVESDDSDDESFSNSELVIMHSLKRADSKRHIKGLGKRIVRSSPKRLHTSPFSESKKQSPTDEDSFIEHILKKSDSKRHINGKGRRVVKTRNTKNLHGSDVLMEIFLNESETSNEDDDTENSFKLSDSKTRIFDRGPSIAFPKKNPGCDAFARCA